MNQYVTGATIRELRERRGLRQADLAEVLAVSDKAVSRWETGRGYPDITLLEPLGQALGVSVAELLSGNPVQNTNVSANMERCKFYRCPLCGNVMVSSGEASVCCHGVDLVPLEAEPADERHGATVSTTDGELYLQVDHPMTKAHHICFMAAVSPDRVQLVRTYPESEAHARLRIDGVRWLYYCCNRDGLFRVRR